jgi:hypothetical protein
VNFGNNNVKFPKIKEIKAVHHKTFEDELKAKTNSL